VSTPRKTAAKPGGGAGSTPSARKAASKTGSKTGSSPAAKTGSGKAGAAGKPAAGTAGRPVPPPPGPGLVVGSVPALARIAGAVAVLAAVLLMIAPAFPLARAGGVDLGGPGNVWAFVPPLPLAAAVAAGGVLALRGRLPRLGLAVLFPAGTVAAGLLLQDAALLRTGSHGTTDLPLGIGTSARYEVGPGLVTAVLAYGVLVAAALLATVAWPRTIMEDTGDLDPRRPRLAAWGLAVGVLTALVLGMAPYSSSIGSGAPTVPERHGLDLLGAAVVALGAAVWAVIAATLRPRLAVVGAYAGLAATLLSIGLSIALLVARSPALGTSAGGVGVLLAALAAAVLGLVTARIGRPAGKA
jgi:iron complex transport system permease protein